METTSEETLAKLEALLGVTFHDRTLLKKAVTHHTCCPDTAVRDSYDTLEFLGDAIISAHVVEYIYRTRPTASEGEMTALKSEVVSRRVFARIGQNLNLFPFICVDTTNLRTFNDRSRDSLCADVLESLVGAIQIDQGSQVAHAFIARVVFPVMEEVSLQVLDTNPKGRLQKVVLQRSGVLPKYKVLEQYGRNNDRIFSVGVFERDTLIGQGKASSIKEASRLAAHDALSALANRNELSL